MTTNLPALRRALAIVGPIATRRASLPILNCLRVEARDGRLTVTATDLDQWAEEYVECEGELPPFCVSAERFIKTMSFGDGESVDVDLVDSRCVIKLGGTSKFPTLDAADFPAAITGLKDTACNSADLAESINKVRWAAYEVPESAPYFDTGKMHLKSVRVSLGPKLMLCESTNGRCLARIKKPSICAKAEFLLPDEFAIATSNALLREESGLVLSDKYVGVRHKSGACYFRLMEGGKFPVNGIESYCLAPSKALGEIPSEETRTATNVIQWMGKNLDEQYPAPIIEASETGLAVSYRNKSGEEYASTIPGRFRPLRFKVPAGQLFKALGCFNGQVTVTAGMEDDISPLRLSNGEMLVLINPMRI